MGGEEKVETVGTFCQEVERDDGTPLRSVVEPHGVSPRETDTTRCPCTGRLRHMRKVVGVSYSVCPCTGSRPLFCAVLQQEFIPGFLAHARCGRLDNSKRRSAAP